MDKRAIDALHGKLTDTLQTLRHARMCLEAERLALRSNTDVTEAFKARRLAKRHQAALAKYTKDVAAVFDEARQALAHIGLAAARCWLCDSNREILVVKQLGGTSPRTDALASLRYCCLSGYGNSHLL